MGLSNSHPGLGILDWIAKVLCWAASAFVLEYDFFKIFTLLNSLIVRNLESFIIIINIINSRTIKVLIQDQSLKKVTSSKF